MAIRTHSQKPETKPGARRNTGRLTRLVGRWWVGIVAAMALALSLWVVVRRHVSTRPLYYTANVLVPIEPQFGSVRVLPEDSSWDATQSIMSGSKGPVYHVELLSLDTDYAFITHLAKKSRRSVRFAVLNAGRGSPHDSLDPRSKQHAAWIAVLSKTDWRVIAAALERSDDPRDRAIADVMRSGAVTHWTVDWAGVLSLTGVVIVPTVLVLWVRWVLLHGLPGRRERLQDVRKHLGQCPTCRYQIATRDLSTEAWLCPECGARGAGVDDTVAPPATPAAAGPSS